MKYHIVGIHKCGTMSLMKFLQHQGHFVLGGGSLFSNKHGIENHLNWKRIYPDIIPVLILRDPIQRMFSHYHYARQDNKDGWRIDSETFEDAINEYPELLRSSDYARWLKVWQPYCPEVYHLEDLIVLSGFPRENITPNRPIMTYKERLFATRAFLQYQRGGYE